MWHSPLGALLLAFLFVLLLGAASTCFQTANRPKTIGSYSCLAPRKGPPDEPLGPTWGPRGALPVWHRSAHSINGPRGSSCRFCCLVPPQPTSQTTNIEERNALLRKLCLLHPQGPLQGRPPHLEATWGHGQPGLRRSDCGIDLMGPKCCSSCR